MVGTQQRIRPLEKRSKKVKNKSVQIQSPVN
jgi:hypothetical protein